MKKLFSLLIALALITVSFSCAFADTVDISEFTTEELIELEAAIENALMGSILTKDTELPLGRYVGGSDFAPGRYVITAVSDYSSPEIYVKVFDESNELVESYTVNAGISCKVTLKEGTAMEISNNNSYEIHAKIRTLAGFLIESSGYKLKANTTATAATSTSEANSDSTVYTYLHDKWDLYKAFSLPGGLIKIENWYRFSASEDNPFNQDHNVMIINPEDGSTDFTWLDDAHTAFSITMSDKENSRFEDPQLVVFALGQ